MDRSKGSCFLRLHYYVSKLRLKRTLVLSTYAYKTQANMKVEKAPCSLVSVIITPDFRVQIATECHNIVIAAIIQKHVEIDSNEEPLICNDL